MKQWGLMAITIYGYETDPYRRRLAAEVISVGETGGRCFAVLSDTLCYPEGGGQPCDLGTLDGEAIVEVQRTGSEIRHYLERPMPLGPAELVLDWERRFDHMQQHTAQHLLSSLTLRHLGWETRSFHIGPEVSDIEIGEPQPERSRLDRVEELVAEAIRQAHPIHDRRVTSSEYAELDVRSRGLPAEYEGDIRLVEIEGVDVNTCGGTHVRSTSEVEVVKIINAEPLRGGSRLHWVAGGRVRKRLGVHEARAYELRQLLDTADHELVATVTHRLQQLAGERRHVRSLEAGLAVAIAERLLETNDPVIELHLEKDQCGALRSIAEELRRGAGSRVALITTDEEPDGRFAIVAGTDFRGEIDAVVLDICGYLDGRGGGSHGIFQGKHASLKRRDDALSYLRGLFA